MISRRPWISGSLILVLLAGCGGQPQYVLQGKVHQGGQIMKVRMVGPNQPIGRVRVYFVPIDVPGLTDSREAIVNFDDGTFSVPGPDRKGIPAGKYQICVEWKDDFPGGPDKLKGAFSPTGSKIIRELTGKDDVDIDVSKPGG